MRREGFIVVYKVLLALIILFVIFGVVYDNNHDHGLTTIFKTCLKLEQFRESCDLRGNKIICFAML